MGTTQQVASGSLLASIAANQHGVFSREQALSVGVSGRQLNRRVSNGQLRRASESVFAICGAPDSTLQRVMAACLAIEGAVASHESAAHLHEVHPLPRWEPVITVPQGRTNRLRGVRVHRTASMPDRHRTVISGIPVTSIERTIIDLAGVISRLRMVEMLDALVAKRRVVIGSVIDDFEMLAASGRAGAAMLRPLLQARANGLVVNPSELERRFSLLVANAGLPEPRAQWRPPWGGSLIGRVDFAYLDQRIVVEVDGRRWHTRVDDFDVDHRRDQLAVVAGWRVLRFTWSQVTERPAEVVGILESVLCGSGRGVG